MSTELFCKTVNLGEINLDILEDQLGAYCVRYKKTINEDLTITYRMISENGNAQIIYESVVSDSTPIIVGYDFEFDDIFNAKMFFNSRGVPHRISLEDGIAKFGVCATSSTHGRIRKELNEYGMLEKNVSE